MARTPTTPTIPTRKRSVLRSIKQGFVSDLYDAHPIAAWLLAVAVAGVMASWIAGAW